MTVESSTVETLENKRKRLIFRSWHRGTREMDIIMGSFADRHIPEFSESQLSEYDDILSLNDPDLYNWYTQKEDVPANLDTEVMGLLLSFKLK